MMSEQELQNILDNSTAVIYVKDTGGRYLGVNRRFEDLFGVSRAEVLGKTDYDLFPREMADRYKAHDQEVMRVARSLEFEEIAPQRDGLHTYISIKFPLYDGVGVVYAVAGISTDITERKRAEEALGQSQALFEKFFECSPDAIMNADVEGRILRVNTQMEKMFGYSRSELLGQPVELLMPERFRGEHPSHRAQYDAHPRSRPMGGGVELYGRRKDGSEFPVDIMLSPLETGKGPLVLSVIRDITERKTAQEALQQSEERFRLLVDGAKDYAIFMLDPDGRVTSWNPGAERIKGYRAEEIIGRNFSQFYTQEDAETGRPADLLKIAAAEGRTENEGWRVRKDGSRFWANVIITALRDEKGQLRSFSKVVRDFTERKRAQEALLLQITNILVANLDVRRLFAAISASLRQVTPHEFASLALLQAAGKELRVQVLYSYGKGAIAPEAVMPLEGSPAGVALASHKPLLINPVDPQDFPSEMTRHFVAEGIASACILPLVSRDRVLGTLNVGSRRESAFAQEDVTLLSQVANQIALAVDNALEFQQVADVKEKLAEEKMYLEDELRTEYNFEEIVGESPSLKRVLKQVETVAPTEATVLILGETGTGKELIARAIHDLSPRRNRTFVKLNCAAIPSGLLESELFGHEKGAFTGAIAQRIGRAELAHLGTLFLDEVGDIPLELQPKLLRVLQEKEFERLGSTRTIPVDIRLVAATNRDLAQMVADRHFRGDLYYRLRVFPLRVPPLRERREDVPLLVHYFAQKHARRMNKRIETIRPEAMEALTLWHWPGNVRELENLIERAVILSRGPVLHVPLTELRPMTEVEPVPDSASLEAAEREHILRVLRGTQGVIGGPHGAAARLGLKRTTLNSKMRKLGITRQEF
jgi:formate hydrogenlyase transcriptional activator